MAHQISWIIENRILYVQDIGICTIQSLEEMVEHVSNLVDNGDAPVHIIHDNRELEKYPINLNALKSVIHPHSKAGWIMFLSKNQFTAFTLSVLTSLMNFSSKECKSMADAITILQRQDPTLPKEIPLPMQQELVQQSLVYID